LLDTLKGQLILLDENSDRVSHELLGNFKNFDGHGGGKKDNLGLSGEKLEDVVDGVLESGREHLIGFVETEHLDGVGLESTSVDHVEDSTGGADNDLRSFGELGHILSDGGSTDTSVTVDVEVVSKGDNDLLDLLSKLSGRGEDKGLGLLDGGVNLDVSEILISGIVDILVEEWRWRK